MNVSSQPKFSDIELKMAIKKVLNKRDQQSPIVAVIKRDEREVIAEAIRTYTGTEAGFSDLEGRPDLLWVRARGYRLGQVKRA